MHRVIRDPVQHEHHRSLIIAKYPNLLQPKSRDTGGEISSPRSAAKAADGNLLRQSALALIKDLDARHEEEIVSFEDGLSVLEVDPPPEPSINPHLILDGHDSQPNERMHWEKKSFSIQRLCDGN